MVAASEVWGCDGAVWQPGSSLCPLHSQPCTTNAASCHSWTLRHWGQRRRSAGWTIQVHPFASLLFAALYTTTASPHWCPPQNTELPYKAQFDVSRLVGLFQFAELSDSVAADLAVQQTPAIHHQRFLPAFESQQPHPAPAKSLVTCAHSLAVCS